MQSQYMIPGVAAVKLAIAKAYAFLDIVFPYTLVPNHSSGKARRAPTLEIE